ncbi:hypothetical protein IX335_000160 [Porphyromonas levii]|uniref:plasmid pRiA4b ORF-3 family protein n=1 Tax=Porphyromonas levii TaxID=28114 RepID=UPI001BA71723|nr:plasmid pRiA4b ORF-3 family protein [Porphyromonas levii]MBR8762963.1 hypothetical protein [Porphyromonas levii]
MVYKFKIQILGIKNPPVWREVYVPSDYTFMELHHVIQDVFGWSGTHLYRFTDSLKKPTIEIMEVDEERDREEDLLMTEVLQSIRVELGGAFAKRREMHEVEPHKIILSEYFNDEAGGKILYEYDFGDSWIHRVSLMAICPDSILNSSGKWVCTGRKGVSPHTP